MEINLDISNRKVINTKMSVREKVEEGDNISLELRKDKDLRYFLPSIQLLGESR